ncbi:MAG: DUF2071 domain-containing protein [Phycisphaeraceae bacterium]
MALPAPVDHRPWPLPRSPWVMRMRWHRLLFMHWAIDPAALRPLVPAPLELDTLAGRAYLGVIPFTMSDVRPRLTPRLGRLSRFPELNVRTYVRVGDKPGVYFFSLDIPRRLPVHVARGVYRLAYYLAEMSVDVASDGEVRYQSRRLPTAPSTHQRAETSDQKWRRPRMLRHLPHPVDPAAPAEFRATYRATGAPAYPEPGTLAHFVTERYCLYTVTPGGRPLRGEIHHGPWPLQPAAAILDAQTMTAPLGLSLPEAQPVLHYAHEMEVVAWPPMRT